MQWGWLVMLTACGRIAFDAQGDAADACPPPAFCDDFERDTVIGAWSSQSTPGQSSLGIETQQFRSPTRSLGAFCATDPATRGAYLEHVLPPGALRVSVTMSYWTDGSLDGDAIVTVELGNPRSAVFIYGAGAELGVYQQNYLDSTSANDFLGPSAVTTWEQLRLEVERTEPGATPTIRVARNGTTLVERPAGIVLGDVTANRVGITFAPPNGAAVHIFIDDVRIE